MLSFECKASLVPPEVRGDQGWLDYAAFISKQTFDGMSYP